MAYARSKLCIVLSTVHLAELLRRQKSHIKIGSLHPGIIFQTALAQNYGKTKDPNRIVSILTYPLLLLISKTPLQGAQTSLYVVNENDSNFTSGGYYSDCELKPIVTKSNTPEIR